VYNIIIWLALFSNGFDETLPVYNPNISFKDKQSCEQFVKDNYSTISLSIKKEFLFQKEIELKEIISMECVIVNNKI
jgi:hypothetical protein